MVELKSSRFSDDDNYNDKTLFLLIEIDNEIEVAANRSWQWNAYYFNSESEVDINSYTTHFSVSDYEWCEVW